MKETKIRNEIHRIIDAGLETEGEITLDRVAVEVAHRPRRPVSSDQSCRRLFVSGWLSSAINQPGAYRFARPGAGYRPVPYCGLEGLYLSAFGWGLCGYTSASAQGLRCRPNAPQRTTSSAAPLVLALALVGICTCGQFPKQTSIRSIGP